MGDIEEKINRLDSIVSRQALTMKEYEDRIHMLEKELDKNVSNTRTINIASRKIDTSEKFIDFVINMKVPDKDTFEKLIDLNKRITKMEDKINSIHKKASNIRLRDHTMLKKKVAQLESLVREMGIQIEERLYYGGKREVKDSRKTMMF